MQRLGVKETFNPEHPSLHYRLDFSDINQRVRSMFPKVR
jgi:hypothetical protein